jgi:hypothetical protein
MPTEEQWKDAYAKVGELVLLYTTLDHQLNDVIIEVMRLAQSPIRMREALVVTLDPRQKIEMLKSRADHIRQQGWKKAVKTHADRLERVAKIRNAVCHTPMVPNKKGDGFEFAPAVAAAKLLKNVMFRSKDDYSIEGLTLDHVQKAKTLAMKALGGGEDILTKFAKARAVLEKKRAAAVPNS